MGGPGNKKRSLEQRTPRPTKKIKKQKAYHSDSDSGPDEAQDFNPVNLLDSDDDDILNAEVDDVGGDSDSSIDDAPPPKKTAKLVKKVNVEKKPAPAKEVAEESSEEDDQVSDEASDLGEGEEEEGDEDDEDDDEGGEDGNEATSTWKKSKRNDPSAFATSLSKILSTKLTASKRADPVLSRSAAAAEASKAILDHALEAKARKEMRQQKKEALERGRVKDVLLATGNDEAAAGGELTETTAAGVMVTERRLRKVAQRGVVKLFNAVRAAQVATAETEKSNKKGGLIGMTHRQDKVNEMTKKGFLDLIASGGGGLKKGALEEA